MPETRASRPPLGRLVLWIFIAVLAALAGWQWSARHSYTRAIEQLKIALAAHDSITDQGLKLSEAETLISSSQRIGPIEQPLEQIVVHRFKGPFRSYFIRLHASKDNVVLSFDTESTIPESPVT